MVRHFLQLYLLIVATLAIASWGQERLWEIYGRDDTAVNAEVYDLRDITGADTIARLERGEVAYMSRADGQRWMLKPLAGGRVLALRQEAAASRGWLEWTLSLVFYALIALVLMMWLWPLTRDLRRLERSTMDFGNRNWSFNADIGSGSQAYPLAQAFRKMAERIDSLIGSHKDMTNAISHEIKTPLTRMRFEIEMARAAPTSEHLEQHLSHINTDITELDTFVTAALDYAILERAEVALNLSEHDFTTILPAVVSSVQRSAPPGLSLGCEVQSDATRVLCDAHLLETVLRNLLYNALRYARQQVRVIFLVEPHGCYRLSVEDDGPGIQESDHARVFNSFVRLDSPSGEKGGYGLGLAIVKRIVEWHGGEIGVSRSTLGGACFSIQWAGSRSLEQARR